MIFKGRNQVPFSYSRWGYTRGGGKTWHGGLDIVGLDSDRILMPDYHGKAISGRVIMATQVPEGSADRTWEWGWFVCVQLDAAQTPDTVNYLYFCHNARNLVTVGQAVRTGDELAVMGNTGNAKYADPPIAHCHFEVRAARSGAGLDPTAYAGIPNAAGTYGEAPAAEDKHYTATPLVDGLRLRPYPEANDDNCNEALGYLKKGQAYPLVQTRDHWAYVITDGSVGGWACISDANGEYLQITEV